MRVATKAVAHKCAIDINPKGFAMYCIRICNAIYATHAICSLCERDVLKKLR